MLSGFLQQLTLTHVYTKQMGSTIRVGDLAKNISQQSPLFREKPTDYFTFYDWYIGGRDDRTKFMELP